MFDTAKKSGKTGSRPGTEQEPKSEVLGNPYRYRHEMGGDETRMRELGRNDYGKKPQDTEKVDNGIPVSPRRTMISG